MGDFRGISETKALAPLLFDICVIGISQVLSPRSYDRMAEIRHIHTRGEAPSTAATEVESGAPLMLCRGRHQQKRLNGGVICSSEEQQI